MHPFYSVVVVMEEAWKKFKTSVNRVNTEHKDPKRAIEEVVSKARKRRAQARTVSTQQDLSDAAISTAARWTDALPLANYEGILHMAPRLVNVVTLAEAVPAVGGTLPLNLHLIGARCSNAYFAPRRFAAVQLAFDAPRSRVLVFHTGRLVGTGCSGPAAARLSIMRAARQLALEADIHLHIRSFSVINQVGAASICARLDCDAFASTHSSTSHYDRSSFVGLAWRPRGESICCEIYSTGKANLPGSVRERDLLGSFSRLIPELIRHSNKKDEVYGLLPESLRLAHYPSTSERDNQRLTKRHCVSIWDMDSLGQDTAGSDDFLRLLRENEDDDAENERLLADAGFV